MRKQEKGRESRNEWAARRHPMDLDSRWLGRATETNGRQSTQQTTTSWHRPRNQVAKRKSGVVAGTTLPFSRMLCVVDPTGFFEGKSGIYPRLKRPHKTTKESITGNYFSRVVVEWALPALMSGHNGVVSVTFWGQLGRLRALSRLLQGPSVAPTAAGNWVGRLPSALRVAGQRCRRQHSEPWP